MAKITNIRYLGKEDTYNMEVEGHHNFSVNGGLIVHNCYDGCSMGLVAWHARVSKLDQRVRKSPIAEHKDRLARRGRYSRRVLS